MTTAHFTAIFERAGDGYSVFFPDMPGCVSAGATFEEAAINAEEALSAHIVELAAGGDPIPAARAPDAIEHDPEVIEVARLLVKAELPGRSVRINITLDEGLVAAIDKTAKNRSGFLAKAAREALVRARETA